MAVDIRFVGAVGSRAYLDADRIEGRIGFDETIGRSVLCYDGTNWAENARRDVEETFAAGIKLPLLDADTVALIGTGGTITSEDYPTFLVTVGAVPLVGNNLIKTVFNHYANVTHSGIVTQQSLASGSAAGSTTISAGAVNTLGSGLHIKARGHYTTDTNPGTAEVRITIGGSVFRTTGTFNLDASITNGFWEIDQCVVCKTTGATGALGDGYMIWKHASSTIAGSEVMHVQQSTTTSDLTIDLTGAFAVDIDWTASDSGTSITCTNFVIDVIR